MPVNFSSLHALVILAASTATLTHAAPTAPKCDTVIIGGGIGGLYSAVHLVSPTNAVCLFEREDRLGGRIDDVVMGKGVDPVGLGAWRFDGNHDKVKSLAAHYNITAHPWNRVPKYIESRGVVAENSTDLLTRAYPAVKAQFGDKDFLGELMEGVQTDLAALGIEGASTKTYITKKYGKEVHEWMVATNGGFSGDFYDPDAKSYFGEFLPAEFTDEGFQYRPEGGMSEFIRKLQDDAAAKGVKIFVSDAVKKISSSKGQYTVETTRNKVAASKLVLNVPPAALKKIDGNVAKSITSSPIFKSILPAVAFKSAAYFAKPFWQPLLGTLEQYVSGSTCLGQFLPYPGQGPKGEAILHTAYSDGPCAEKVWPHNDDPKAAWKLIKPQLESALRRIDPKLTVPEPIQTVSHFWDEGAWHWQVAGSNVSMAQVQEWAAQPLTGEPVYLTNEAYGVRRTWAMAALQTAQNGLQKLGVTPQF